MGSEQIQMSPVMRGALEESARRLAGAYDGVFSAETVQRALRDSWGQMAEHATVLSPFFPTLVERFAREQLQAAAQVEGLVAKDLPEVLFVCVHNAGRSQMAAALTHHLSHGSVGVRSAGSHPEEHLDPVVIEAMAEIGLDVTHEFPKPLTDVVVRAADVVVTMGCGEACPVYPGKHYENWPVPDPVGRSLDGVRLVRDEINVHVRDLLSALSRDFRVVDDATKTPTGGIR